MAFVVCNTNSNTVTVHPKPNAEAQDCKDEWPHSNVLQILLNHMHLGDFMYANVHNSVLNANVKW